jgi:hypothetical protein
MIAKKEEDLLRRKKKRRRNGEGLLGPSLIALRAERDLAAGMLPSVPVARESRAHDHTVVRDKASDCKPVQSMLKLKNLRLKRYEEMKPTARPHHWCEKAWRPYCALKERGQCCETTRDTISRKLL